LKLPGPKVLGTGPRDPWTGPGVPEPPPSEPPPSPFPHRAYRALENADDLQSAQVFGGTPGLGRSFRSSSKRWPHVKTCQGSSTPKTGDPRSATPGPKSPFLRGWGFLADISVRSARAGGTSTRRFHTIHNGGLYKW
jgi:hypothetical protein